MKTDEELKKLAVDIYDGLVFTDRHLTNPDDLALIFMPIVFGAITEENSKDLGLIYEYLSAAGPRSMNGMPMFMSMRSLTIDETKKMFEFYEEYKKMKDSFLSEKKE